LSRHTDASHSEAIAIPLDDEMLAALREEEIID